MSCRLHSSIDRPRRCPWVYVSAIALGIALPATGHSAPGETAAVSLNGASVAAPGSRGAGGKPHQCVSADGRYVVFESDAALIAADTNGVTDIYLRDRTLGVTRRISVAVDGTPANGVSRAPVISANGHYVAFESSASNLFRTTRLAPASSCRTAMLTIKAGGHQRVIQLAGTGR